MTAAMTSRRSIRSEITPTGKTPSADPTTIAEVNRGAPVGRHSDLDGEHWAQRERCAVRGPGGENREA